MHAVFFDFNVWCYCWFWKYKELNILKFILLKLCKSFCIFEYYFVWFSELKSEGQIFCLNYGLKWVSPLLPLSISFVCQFQAIFALYKFIFYLLTSLKNVFFFMQCQIALINIGFNVHFITSLKGIHYIDCALIRTRSITTKIQHSTLNMHIFRVKFTASSML